MSKMLEYYINLPYTKDIKEMNDESGHYFYGRILELSGCQSTGDTKEELEINLKEAMEVYIEEMLAEGIEIPEPINRGYLEGM